MRKRCVRCIGGPGIFAGLIVCAAGAAPPPKAWVATYSGPAGFYNIVWDVAVDSDGNSYVTGESATGTGAAIATVKYDPAGNQLWAQRFPTVGSDRPFHVQIAPDKNVIVAGQADGASQFLNYVAIKYDAATGNQIWDTAYNGAGDNLDSALGLAIDQEGDVYMTGQSWGGATAYDIVTIKLSGTDGALLWDRSFNGPASGPEDGPQDAGLAIALDDVGNAYVTGWAQAGYDFDCECNVYAMATIKYGTQGNELWSRLYGDGLNSGQSIAVAVGQDHQPVVTGLYAGGWTTIKYDANSGDAIWINSYYGPAGSGGENFALALDTHDNVLVAGGVCTGSSFCGESLGVVKYDAAGNQLWDQYVVISDPQSAGGYAADVTSDCRDNVYIAGFNQYFNAKSEAVTAMFSAAGEQRWVDQYLPEGGRLAGAKAIAIAPSGSVIVGGNYDIAPGASFFMTIDYALRSGDLDASGCIDLVDLSALLASYGRDNAGDLNCDDVTDLLDLAAILAEFGAGCQ